MLIFRWIWLILVAFGVCANVAARSADTTEFRVGAADKDITPPVGIPMWGYGPP